MRGLSKGDTVCCHGTDAFFESWTIGLQRYTRRVSVTLCCLGSIDTEANRKSTAGVIDPKHVKRESPVECAEAVLRGALGGKEVVYFPKGAMMFALLVLCLPRAVRKALSGAIYCF